MNKVFNKFLFVITILAFCALSSKAEILRDEFIDETLGSVELTKPVSYDKYNYESFEGIPIKLKINEKITTKKDGIYDGQMLNFTVRTNVKYKNQIIIKQGTPVKAQVSTYLTKGMNGIPGTIIVDNFQIDGIDSSKIKGFYIKKGLNLSLLVFPIKWALTPIPGVGSLTNFILGGNATLSDKDTVIIYYYPLWGKIEKL